MRRLFSLLLGSYLRESMSAALICFVSQCFWTEMNISAPVRSLISLTLTLRNSFRRFLLPRWSFWKTTSDSDCSQGSCAESIEVTWKPSKPGVYVCKYYLHCVLVLGCVYISLYLVWKWWLQLDLLCSVCSLPVSRPAACSTRPDLALRRPLSFLSDLLPGLLLPFFLSFPSLLAFSS